MCFWGPCEVIIAGYRVVPVVQLSGLFRALVELSIALLVLLDGIPHPGLSTCYRLSCLGPLKHRGPGPLVRCSAGERWGGHRPMRQHSAPVRHFDPVDDPSDLTGKGDPAALLLAIVGKLTPPRCWQVGRFGRSGAIPRGCAGDPAIGVQRKDHLSLHRGRPAANRQLICLHNLPS